jgi:tetratricopeptide (TPR) repeat protein
VKFSLIRYIVFVVILSVVAVSCSNKKDGTSYRVYHNTTAYYNGYFNANELIKKGERHLKTNHKEDYDKILPIFIYGDDQLAKATYPDMEKAIDKCETVIKRHTIKADSKGQKRPEYNKWIDENYIVIGKAYFYKKNYAKAAEVFNYVNRKYKNPNTGATSNTWLAKTAVLQEEYGKAIQALNKVDPNHKDVTDAQRAEYYLAYTDALLKQNKPDKAVEKLELAIKHTKKKKERARLYFILAQIHQNQNNSSGALANYEQVIKSKPVYELEFYARINKALSYSRQGGSSAEIQKQLFKMLKDEKNKDYRDQIYYALGDVAWEEHRRADAITFYEKSLEENLTNTKQKAKTFLRLADLYFDERHYSNAQLYYDSTLTSISAEHDRYGIVRARAESLTELVAGLNAIHLNDSLSAICSLAPAQREKRLAEIQMQMQAQRDEQRRRDELAAQKAAAAAAAANAGSATGGSGITGTFWAYNDNLKKKGLQEFKDKWGDRPLKDNWRLQSLLSQSFGPGEDQESQATAESTSPEGTEAGENKVNDKYTAPSIDALKATLPCDDPATLAKIEQDAAAGYYNAGVVYKEKLNDDDNAINTWEELLANIDSSGYHPTAYYQLYRTWLSKETSRGYVKDPLCYSCSSQYWGDEIKNLYPGSEWSMLVDNPNYLDNQDKKLEEEEAAYQLAYSFYSSRNYPQARAMADTVINTQPNNHLICKYRLMRAICTGYSDARYGSTIDYQRELSELIQACPGTDEAKQATDLLKAVKVDETPVIPGNEKTDESSGQPVTDNKENPADNLIDNPYKYDANAEHYIAVILPVAGSDLNAAKLAVADFNSQFYTSAGLKVSNNLLSKENHLILIKSYKQLTEGIEYVKSFKSDTDKLKTINESGYRVFLISKQNYITLFKNKDVDQYIDFYMVYYPQ